MKVAVTGGAGFLGRHVVRELRQRGHAAVVIDRRATNWATPPEVSVVTADIADAPSMMKALRGCDGVIHAAFAPPYATAREQQRVNADGVHALCELACDSGVQRLVMVSSTVVGRALDSLISHRHLPAGRLATYAQTRRDGEMHARSAVGLSVGIARPRTLVGDGGIGAFALQFASLAAGRPVIVLGDASSRYQVLDIADFADALVRFVVADHVGVLEFGASDVLPLIDELARLVTHSGTRAEIVHVPNVIGRAIVTTAPLVGLRPLSEMYESMVRHNDVVVDARAAQQSIGWSARRSNVAALITSYDWFVNHRSDVPNHPVPWSHRVGLAAMVSTARLVDILRQHKW